MPRRSQPAAMNHHYQSSWMDGAAAPRPDFLLASGGASLPLLFQQQESHIRDEEVVAPPPARYSAEERRERIDKYRNKRNHRNFQKKITYACRKTLADSRPRVKGRFARGSGGECDETQVVQAAAGISSELPPANDGKGSDDSRSMPEWWPAMQEALGTGVDLDNLCCDEEMLAAYLGVSSISLYSPPYSPSASGQ